MKLILRARMRFASVGLACLALTACGNFKEKFGRQHGQTVVTVNAPAVCPSGYCTSAWPSIGGGMMVYAVGVNGTSFATTIPLNLNSGSSASASIGLPNGEYMFYALAWDGSGSIALQGQAGCGSSGTPKLLTGGAQTVNFTVSNTSCNFAATTMFNESGSQFNSSGSNFGHPQLYLCNVIGGGPSCSGLTTTYYTANARFRMEGYVRNGPGAMTYVPSLGINGPCFTLATAGYSVPDRIPVGNSAAGQNNFVAVSLDLFLGGSCTGTPNKTIHFPNGIAAGAAEVASATNGTSGIYNLFVDVGP